MASGSGSKRKGLQVNLSQMIYYEGQYYTPAAARQRGIIHVSTPEMEGVISFNPSAMAKLVPEKEKKHWSPRATRTLEEKMSRLEQRFWAFLKKNPDRYASPMAQPIKLRLGNDCLYLPDFSAIMETGSGPQFCLFETKGLHAWEDSKVKLKVAASMFPWWPFYLVTQIKGHSDFHIEHVQP